MPHKFKIGELVRLTVKRQVMAGTFTIVGFLPEIDGEPAYRIRHERSGDNYVARESELTRR
jgi:hypothetical protein